MNLSDPELELVDPTPNVHLLFIHFDQVFFSTKLASRAVVRWSKRMYSCAGICSYDRGGLCDIALSEPLLKLRPRKDLVETLLHEMIHAYLFVTRRDQDRDGHGPNFKEHMYRINKAAGLNISIYHDFHEEVELYRTHWWRCNGPCQIRRPHFGIVRRSSNRAPSHLDYWWNDHQRKCGGTFVKIKEPENFGKRKKASPKPSGDITKYINTNTNNSNNSLKVTQPVLKDSNNVSVKSNVTKNSSSTIVISSKKNNIVFNSQIVKPVVFSGKGQTVSGNNNSNKDNVVETVRNVWANKQLSPTSVKNNNTNKIPRRNSFSAISVTSSKHKADDTHILSPPTKVKKIDDYFKSTATSLLKDLYGTEFEIKETNNNRRLSVVPINSDLVDCPVCSDKVSSEKINRHLDECLNKQVIESISKDNIDKTVINVKTETNRNNEQLITNTFEKGNSPMLPNLKTEVTPMKKDLDEINKKLDNPVTPTDFMKKNLNEIEKKLDNPIIKIEPGTSKNALITINEQKCPCCGNIVNIAINEHLDECLAFFDSNTTMPIEGASTSFANETIVIDEDDILDETLTLNASGTKLPCPCCLKMVEQDNMNNHLDLCLS